MLEILDRILICHVLVSTVVAGGQLGGRTRVEVSGNLYHSIADNLVRVQLVWIVPSTVVILKALLPVSGLVVVQRNFSAHDVHDVLGLPVIIGHVASGWSPEVVVSIELGLCASARGLNHTVIIQSLHGELTVSDKVVCITGDEVRLPGKGSQVTADNSVAELDPLSLVSVVDNVALLESVAIVVGI